jgi:hypothetical protein
MAPRYEDVSDSYEDVSDGPAHVSSDLAVSRAARTKKARGQPDEQREIVRNPPSPDEIVIVLQGVNVVGLYGEI